MLQMPPNSPLERLTAFLVVAVVAAAENVNTFCQSYSTAQNVGQSSVWVHTRLIPSISGACEDCQASYDISSFQMQKSGSYVNNHLRMDNDADVNMAQNQPVCRLLTMSEHGSEPASL